jgi:uncharacterized protein YjbI with pentapeptide repeats
MQRIYLWWALAALSLALLLGSVLVFPRYLVDWTIAVQKAQQPMIADRLKAENDIRTTLLQGIGAIGLLLGALTTWRQLQDTLTQNREQLRLSREGQVTDRFTRAIDQLGSGTLDVRLGGIYALERIAKDSARDYGPIMEVLTAFVRERAPWKSDKPPAAEEFLQPRAGELEATNEVSFPKPLPKPAKDIQAILTVLGRRAKEQEPVSLDLSRTDLQGAYLRWANLERLNLNEANLHWAFLRGVNLKEATLYSVNLKEAEVDGAHLEGAKICGANLKGASLRGAHLEGTDTDLSFAHLEGADLREAHLEKADLRRVSLETRLEGGYSFETHLEGAHLSEAHLEGANLRGAHLEKADLRGAHLEPYLFQDGEYPDETHLEGAHLNDAHLEGADFADAHLEGASLNKAFTKGTIFLLAHLQGADLSETNLTNEQIESAKVQ